MQCLGLVSPEARGQVNLRVRFEGGVLLAKRPYVGLDPEAEWETLWAALAERGWRSVP